MGTLAVGASLILEEGFSASMFWNQVKRSEATVVNFIGMMLPVLLKQPRVEFNPPNQVRVCYGSPAFAPEVLIEFEKRFSTRVLIGFGLTECIFGTIERLGQSHRPRSSGVARWHPDGRFVNELRIVGEQDDSLPPREVGEILLRNPAVTPGYWQNDEQTTEALRGGWFHTGDLGRVDEEGYLYFVDRKKDVIRRRGENIASSEVEEVLKREPRILDCAVIGVPSELAEEEVKACVVLRPGMEMRPEEVVAWCAERLAHFKIPRYVEFRADLPRTPSLRVRKDLLRRGAVEPVGECFDREKADIRLR
jgi:crotonobetaine/carnitine-CoA ligase